MSHHLKQLIFGSSALFAYRLIGAALTFIAQVLLIRWVGAEEFGRYIWAFSLATLFGNLVGLGLLSATPRLIKLARANRDAAMEKGFIMSGYLVIITMSFLMMLAAWGISIWKTGEFPEHLFLAFLLIPLFGISRFSGSICITNRWMALGQIPNQVLRPLLFLLAAASLWTSSRQLDPDVLMLLQVLATLVTVVVILTPVLYLSRKLLMNNRARFALFSWLRVSLPLMAITMVVDYFPELILILFGSALSNTDMSICSAALRLIMVVTFALTAIDTFIAPDIAGLAAEKKYKELEIVTRRSARVRAFASLGAFLLFLLFGRELLLIFGEEFQRGYTFLLFLATGQLFISIFGPCAQVLALSGHQNRSLVASIISVLVLVIGTLGFLSGLGLNGAGLITLLTNITWITLLYLGVRKSLGIRTDIFH